MRTPGAEPGSQALGGLYDTAALRALRQHVCDAVCRRRWICEGAMVFVFGRFLFSKQFPKYCMILGSARFSFRMTGLPFRVEHCLRHAHVHDQHMCKSQGGPYTFTFHQLRKSQDKCNSRFGLFLCVPTKLNVWHPAVWSSGMIPGLGPRGPGFNCRNSPVSAHRPWRCQSGAPPQIANRHQWDSNPRGETPSV